MKETDYQRKLLDALEETGGYGYKQSNRFLSGVADLVMTLPGLPTRMVEVKLDHKRGNGVLPCALTALQRKYLRKHKAAGGLGGWVVFDSGMDREYVLWVGSDPEAEHAASGTCFIIQWGKQWPIRDILTLAG